ncbi:vacuolar protein-sorting-associated protein 36-like [Schistocerca gregaria]|uniref:vacuolar protein-sorting-associated protein 36-like n=1 Tax=Schistocerca gregaria TaxID=7010 RepID=UPI00211E90B5|nr:vacuolar protein-sorting-associated protein 36-like [Schistocerca gregaria]
MSCLVFGNYIISKFIYPVSQIGNMEPFFPKESNRLELKKNEIEQLVTTCVVEDKISGISGNFVIYLTNLRIFFREMPSVNDPLVHPRHWTIQLERIHHFNAPNSLVLGKNSTLLLYLFDPTDTDAHYPVTIIFQSNQLNRFVRALSKQIEKRHWLQHPKGSGLNISKSTFSTSDAGVQGITRLIEKKNEDIGSSMQEAFKSLDSLFEKAAEMTAIANKFASDFVVNNLGKNEDFEFQYQVMQKMGIRNPVTSHRYGDWDLYYDELAREIDEFLAKNVFTQENDLYLNFLDSRLSEELAKQPSNKSLHIDRQFITLTDLYCLLNRARGTALVSPDELLEACKRLKKLNLRASLIEMTGNLMAIVSSKYDGKVMLQEIATLLEESGPMTAMQFSIFQCVPLPISKHLLLEAEKNELACRDESLEGLLFWKNIFLHPWNFKKT